MDFLKNIFGTGANIFGAGTSMDMDKYEQAGLLEKADYDKAQDQSLMRGLLGSALGYLAQPKNQDYGSSIPYLAKGFQQGMTQAQEPFTNLQKSADTNAKLNTIITNKQNTEDYTKSIDTFIASHPEYGEVLKNMPQEQAGEIIRDYYKPQAPNETALAKEKTIKALAGQIMTENPGMQYPEAEGKARIKIALKPGLAIDMGGKRESIEQENVISYVDKTQKEALGSYENSQDMALANILVEKAGSAQGFGSGLMADVDTFLQRFPELGIQLQGQDQLSAIRALKSVQIKLALGEKKPGTGPMTDADFLNYLNTTVQLTNPKATNKILVHIAKTKQKMMRDFARAQREYVRENPYGLNVYDFEDKWMQGREEAYLKELYDGIDKYASVGASVASGATEQNAQDVYDIIQKPLGNDTNAPYGRGTNGIPN